MRGICIYEISPPPLGTPQGKSAFNVVVTIGHRKNKQGRRVPHLKTKRVYGTKADAEAEGIALRHAVNTKTFIEPSKMTFGEYLDQWLESDIKAECRATTHVSWKGIIENYMKPALGHVLLHELTRSHVAQYLSDLQGKVSKFGKPFSPKTIAIHRSIINTAYNCAQEDGMAPETAKNPASMHRRRKRNRRNLKRAARTEVLKNCWTQEQMRLFLSAVLARGNAQDAAFFALALDTGMRKGELLGLQWKDLEGTRLRVSRQLLKGGLKNVNFGLPKNGEARTLELDTHTLALLMTHKRKQAELKMANRTTYRSTSGNDDRGEDLMFAQAFEHHGSKHSALGAPVSVLTLTSKLDKYCKAAGVPRLTMHGMRHTCATLLLAAGMPPQVVQKRLGHADISMTLGVYAHVLPTQQAEAASTIGKMMYR